jgi:inosine/xanthosine triphosphate pyrophosphatase family protein
MTFAQMDEDLKNSISHRGNALRKVLDILADEAKKH